MKIEKYNKEMLEKIIIDSKNFSDVVRKITNKEKPHGGMIAYLKKMAIKHNIDFSHFTGKAWNKGLKGVSSKRLTPEEFKRNYLSKKSLKKTCNNNIKKWLFSLGFKKKYCEKCNIGDIWNGEELILQLDHIDGDNTNNEISNLRILCPNCYTQTHNYAGRKNKNYEINNKN